MNFFSFQLNRDACKSKIKSIEANNHSDDPLMELAEQNRKIQFDIVMKLYSILRYLIDNLSK